MRVVGKLRVPTRRSRDILQEAKGIILVESTQIRWFSRWSGRGGWSGWVAAQQRPRVSKLRLKGLSDYHCNETVVEAARWGATGPKKGLLSRHVCSKKEIWKATLNLTEKGQNAAYQIKSTTDKKEKIAYYNSRWRCRCEKWRQWRWWWARASWGNHKSMLQCFRVLRVKCQ
jgi:hypothetical protein